MNELTLWSLIFVLSLPILIIAIPHIYKRHIFPYLYVVAISLEYLNPLFLGQLFTIGKIIPMTLFVMYIFGTKGNLGLRTYKLFVPLLLLAFYFVLTLFWAVDPLYGTERGISFVLLLISFWLIAHSSQDEIGLKHFIGAFVFLSIVISILSIMGFIDKFVPGTFLRYRALKLNPINMSLLIIYGTIPIIISIILKQTNKWGWLSRKWFPFVIALNMIGLVVSTSKTGIIVFLLCIFLLWNIASLQARFRMVIIGIFVSLFVFVVNTKFPIVGNMYTRIEYELSGTEQVSTVEQLLPDRIQIWEEAIILFLRYPAFGAGLTSFEPMTTIAKVPHNDILRTLAEGGIIGGVLWISVLVIGFVVTIRARRISVQNRLAHLEWLSRVMFMYVIVLISFSQSLDLIFNKFIWVVFAMTSSLWGISLSKIDMINRYKSLRGMNKS